MCDSDEFGIICLCFFFFQAEDGIRDLVRSRGLGDVYKRQPQGSDSSIWVRFAPELYETKDSAETAAVRLARDLSLIHI